MNSNLQYLKKLKEDDDGNIPFMTIDDNDEALGQTSVTMVDKDAATEPIDSFELTTKKFLKILRQNRQPYLNTLYGVHRLNNIILIICDAPIRFDDQFIYVRDKKNLKPVNLFELLLRQTLVECYICLIDINNYKEITMNKNAHKK